MQAVTYFILTTLKVRGLSSSVSLEKTKLWLCL